MKNFNIVKSLIILFLINLILFIIFKGTLGLIYSDFSREVYIPYAMNDGDVLYKDIFSIFAPLGYQINAFLLFITGMKLNTFYYSGFINAVLFSFAVFLILRFFLKNMSRISYSGINISYNIFCLNTVCMILVSCVYGVSLTNYITPYSYSMVYALNAFLWALLSLIYYIKKGRALFLVFSAFAYGASIMCKYDFIPFGLILLFFAIRDKNGLKIKLYSISAFLAIPFISLSDLYLKGVDFNILSDSVQKMILMSKSYNNYVLYKFLGFIPSLNSLKDLFFSFAKTSVIVLCLFILLNAGLKDKFIKQKHLNALLLLISVCVLTFLFIQSNSFYFKWIGTADLIILITLLIKKNINTVFFALLFCVVLCSYKCLFAVSFNSYGTYYFPMLFVCFILYLVMYKLKDKQITVLFIIISLFSISFYLSNFYRKTVIFNSYLATDKGSFFAESCIVRPMSELLAYIRENTKKDDTVLVLPEGAVINFLSDRKSNNKYFHLIPSNIEIFNEDNIVKDLEKNLPDYIVIQPMSYGNFNQTFFCESFGIKICSLIPRCYERPVVFGDEFHVAIYKRKEN